MANELKFNSPIVLVRLSSDPGSAFNGEMYYNTTSNKIRAYVNGSFSDLSTGTVSLTGQTLNEFNVVVGNSSNLSAALDTNALGDILVSTAGGLNIKAGAILNADINASAAIAYSKLALSNSILNADINSSAAIAYSKLNLSASIVNADIASAAAIALNKLAAVTANKAIISDASGFLSASAVSNVELGYVAGVTSAIQTQINGKLSLSGGTMSGDIAMGGNKVTGLGSPSTGSDAANKTYVDSVAEGLKPKAAVRLATTANITLSAPQTIDGVSAVAGDRILVKDQTLAQNNGIYIVAAGAWSRSTDFDSLSPIDEVNGALVAVQLGTANAGKIFVESSVVVTLGTDPINFVFFNSSSSLVGGNGITISGSNISVNHDGNGLTFSGVQLALLLDSTTLSKSGSGLKVATGGITNNEINASAAIAYSKLALTGNIVNADINASAAIARSKLVAGTANHVIINDGSGNFSSEAQLSVLRGGTGVNGSSAANGNLLIGNGSGYSLAGLTAGTGISITNGAGSITVANSSVRSDDIPNTTFSGSNNVSSAANVTGFSFSTSTTSAFQAIVSVAVSATSSLYETFTLNGVYKIASSTWDLTSSSNGDFSQVAFSITSSGAVQYTSGNYTGFSSLKIRFRAITLQDAN